VCSSDLKLAKNRHTLEVLRADLVNTSRAELLRAKFSSGAAIRIKISFLGEGGIDVGGLRAEWISLLRDQILARRGIELIAPTPNGDCWQLAPVGGGGVADFRFFGRFLGIAMKTRPAPAIPLHRALVKQLLGEVVCLDDLRGYDGALWQGLRAILDSPAAALDWRFETPDGQELVANGSNTVVTDANKGEFVRLMLDHVFIAKCRPQLTEFLAGFREMMPMEQVSYFTCEEIERRLEAAPTLDVRLLRSKCKYECKLAQPISKEQYFDQFFGALEGWTAVELTALLKFATGMTNIPASEASSSHGAVMTIELVSGHGYPIGHTCSNVLTMRNYGSLEELREKLRCAIACDTFGRS
jgi:E3 ubiquitin-protein ligase HUWE1